MIVNPLLQAILCSPLRRARAHQIWSIRCGPLLPHTRLRRSGFRSSRPTAQGHLRLQARDRSGGRAGLRASRRSLSGEGTHPTVFQQWRTALPHRRQWTLRTLGSLNLRGPRSSRRRCKMRYRRVLTSTSPLARTTSIWRMKTGASTIRRINSECLVGQCSFYEWSALNLKTSRRCDRILWKSTIQPEQDTDDTESTKVMPLRAKMGQIFNAFRPSSLRSRRDSTWSMNHPDLSQQPTATPRAGQTADVLVEATPNDKRISAAPQLSPLASLKPHSLHSLTKTRSFDNLPRASEERRTSLTRVTSFEPSSIRPPTSPLSGGRVPMRHANTISPVVQVMPSGDTSTLVSSTETPAGGLDIAGPGSASPSNPAPMFRWLLPFLYRDGAHQGAPPGSPATEVPPPPPPPPKRGDVVCLRYDTLDDKGMRRLEGRSDHRPVIGSYALYI